jgi:hypothetical protein
MMYQEAKKQENMHIINSTFIIAASGSFDVILDDGKKKSNV